MFGKQVIKSTVNHDFDGDRQILPQPPRNLTISGSHHHWWNTPGIERRLMREGTSGRTPARIFAKVELVVPFRGPEAVPNHARSRVERGIHSWGIGEKAHRGD